jgi:hypothetical protein
MPLKELRELFPHANFAADCITSPIDRNYNCVAWAIGDKRKWWESFGTILPSPFPPYHWPDDLPQDKLPDTYIRFFQRHNFEVAEDSELEPGIEKIALYIRGDSVQHVARQLPSGRWTSKLGPQEDIEHRLRDIESDGPVSYGRASIFMKRQRRE